jgi:L-alanine-DL-glutamate epimerase-like enolase superfamily enzyme
MIVNRPEVVDGRVALPTGPGFGWELDRDFIQHYRVDSAT